MSVIRVASINDCDAIIDFIQREWKSDHIFCLNRDFFLYQYQDREKLNFIISLSDDGKISGVLGFIRASSSDESDVWAALWKVSANNGNAMLGLQLMDFLRNMFPSRVFCSGINDKTIPLYQYLGMHTGILKLFVMINQQIKSYKVCEINSSLITPVFNNSQDYQLVELGDKFDYTFESTTESVPFKDKNYYLKRFLNHPIYKYKPIGIYFEGNIKAVIITREQALNDSKILRLVDFIGDEKYLKFVSGQLYNLLIANDYEYIDFICHGFNKKELLNANFIEVDLDSHEIIIPNYFSPFLKKNVKINFSADKDSFSQLKICKADGDQDRPS